MVEVTTLIDNCSELLTPTVAKYATTAQVTEREQTGINRQLSAECYRTGALPQQAVCCRLSGNTASKGRVIAGYSQQGQSVCHIAQEYTVGAL
jgi:hypothetical protein